jgi:hypothetical protein
MMSALLLETRIAYSERAFAELVIWRLSKPVPGCVHDYKYRLAYVVDDVCVLRYDNESGKGDHRHVGTCEHAHRFASPSQLVADFECDIARWNDENFAD